MDESFYNLYNIIQTSAKSKFKSILFPSIADSNPIVFDKGKIFTNYTDYADQGMQYLIFHDQEPIQYHLYKTEWNLIKRRFNLFRTDNILGNSEINSKEKDELLKLLGWKDFYWFSNGFLALEWYRYYRYMPSLEKDFEPDYTFSCYNRLIEHRMHRAILSGVLLGYGKDKIILSCKKTDPLTNQTLEQLSAPYPQYSNYLNNLIKQDSDIVLNTVDYGDTNKSFEIEVRDFRRSFCHIVTERLFFEDRIHLTEKTFRPIVCCRPFIMASSPLSLKYLKGYGFKTFDKFWDESYDEELDHFKRLDKIITVMDGLAKLTKDEMRHILKEMSEILIYNRRHFYSEFQHIITNELYENLNKVLVDKSPNDGHLMQVMATLSPEQITVLENGVESLEVTDPTPFVSYDYLNSTKEVQQKLFDDNVPYFRLLYKITNQFL